MESVRDAFGRLAKRNSANSTTSQQTANSPPEKANLKRALERIEKDSMRYKNLVTKPWLDRNGRRIWSWQRIAVAHVVRSQAFETFMGIVIVANLVLMMFETNADASCYPDYAEDVSQCPYRSSEDLGMKVANIILQLIYTTECLLRAFVERDLYIWNRWNQLDLLCTIPGWITLALSSSVNFAVFRTLRVVRLLRAGRLLISIPEIYILMSGLTSALKPIIFGSIMLIAVIVIWAIIVVEFLHPVNTSLAYNDCERCKRAFAGVYTASLTLFSQLVAQDNWSEISVPLAEEFWWTTPLLFSILMTVSLGVMNLILAIVVEKAAEARENDQERKMQQKEEERERNMIELAVLCDRMDNDGSGALSLQEMLDGYDTDTNFNSLMTFMDIERDDMQTIFKVLDSDQSGEVDYVEFCHHLGSCKKRDPLMMSSLTRYSVMEMRNLVATVTKEIGQALERNNQMLQEQLDLLCHVPGCETAAQELKKQRSHRSTTNSLDTSEGLGTGNFNFTDLPKLEPLRSRRSRGKSMDAEEVLNNMTKAGKQLEKMQSQLDTLMAKAEELQEDLAEETRTKSSEQGGDLREMTVWASLDERFQELVAKFHQRYLKEEKFQLDLQEMLQSITVLMEKRPLVHEEL